MVSENIKVSNDMNKNSVKSVLDKEIQFYDQDYFDTGRDKAYLNLYYSGHGLKGNIKLGDMEALYYKDIIDYIATGINNHHLQTLRQVTKEVEW